VSGRIAAVPRPCRAQGRVSTEITSTPLVYPADRLLPKVPGTGPQTVGSMHSGANLLTTITPRCLHLPPELNPLALPIAPHAYIHQTVTIMIAKNGTIGSTNFREIPNTIHIHTPNQVTATCNACAFLQTSLSKTRG